MSWRHGVTAAQARSVTAGPSSPGIQPARASRAAAGSRPRPASVTTRSARGRSPASAPAGPASGAAGHHRTVGSSERRSGVQALAAPWRASPWIVSTTSSRATLAESAASRQLVLTVASIPSPPSGLGDQDRARGLVVGEPLDDLLHRPELVRAGRVADEVEHARERVGAPPSGGRRCSASRSATSATVTPRPSQPPASVTGAATPARRAPSGGRPPPGPRSRRGSRGSRPDRSPTAG